MKGKWMFIINGLLLAALGVLIWQYISVTNQPNTALPTTTMTIGSRTYTLEIARRERERNRGLMHRKSMPEDHGMIFVFGEEDVLKFWMKNTHIPLDIIYVNSSGKVVSIKQMTPLDESGVSSDAPARYAIELNHGQAAKAGVKVGDILQIPAAAR